MSESHASHANDLISACVSAGTIRAGPGRQQPALRSGRMCPTLRSCTLDRTPPGRQAPQLLEGWGCNLLTLLGTRCVQAVTCSHAGTTPLQRTANAWLMCADQQCALPSCLLLQFPLWVFFGAWRPHWKVPVRFVSLSRAMHSSHSHTAV